MKNQSTWFHIHESDQRQDDQTYTELERKDRKSWPTLQMLQPIWMPFNESSERLVRSIAESFNLPVTGKKGQKYKTVISSFVYYAQRALGGNEEDCIGWPQSNNYWSNFPLVGRLVSQNVCGVLDGTLIHKVPGSGKRHFYITEAGRWAYDAQTTTFEVDTALREEPNFLKARFVDVGRPPVLIVKPETEGARRIRKSEGLPSPKYSKTEADRRFKSDIGKARVCMTRLNSFWTEHPLVLPEGHAAASAQRVFHEGRMDAGGRLYGAWTNRDEVLREDCTIDGEEVCQIDINASQPVLFSILTGIPMKVNKGKWCDLYGELATDIDADRSDEIRKLLKAVSMELIGTGNPNKKRPSDKLIEDTGITLEEWDCYKEKILEKVPALGGLDSDYMNGPNFLTYHESQMIMLTLERLREQNIPAYPVHDSLISPLSKLEDCKEILIETVMEYVFNKSGLRVKVALSESAKSIPKLRRQGHLLE